VNLAERVVALHRALVGRAVPHAFGGAIALAYWTLDPRATNDIDLNVFVPAEQPADALEALPDGVDQPPGTADVIVREGQIRLWWDETPVDLFFDYAELHREAAAHLRTVPFADTEIPVLGAVELAAFKSCSTARGTGPTSRRCSAPARSTSTRCARRSRRSSPRTTRATPSSMRRQGTPAPPERPARGARREAGRRRSRYFRSAEVFPRSWRAMIRSWICWVPSKMSRILASRAHFSSSSPSP
jgi:hypothetical protein